MRESAHRLGLAGFWRWWVGQLSALVPAAPRAAVQRSRLRPVLLFDASSALLFEPRASAGALTYEQSARIDLAGDAAAVAQAGRAVIESLPRASYGGLTGGPSVLVALAPSKVLRKRLVLPAALEENLRQALGYDLDRHTPFRADELYFDAAVAERNLAKREIVVDWAAALRSDVDQARRSAESFGASVVGVVADSPERADPTRLARLNLLPDADRVDTAWWRRWRLWLPAAIVLAVAGVAMLLPIWQKRDYVVALNRQVDEAHVQANAADALRTQLEQQMGDYNFVLARKYGYTSATQLIDDVTKLLPDDTWLTQLELKTTIKGKETQREMLLRGESGNAGRLVSLLEDSKLFEQAAPRSPTTKIQPGPGEIFDLGAQLKPLSPPGAIAATDVVPVATNTAPTPNPAAATPAQPAPSAPQAANAPVPAARAPAPPTPPVTAAPAPRPPPAVATPVQVTPSAPPSVASSVPAPVPPPVATMPAPTPPMSAPPAPAAGATETADAKRMRALQNQ